MSIYLGTVSTALTIFYALLGVTFFVPILGGLYLARANSTAALAAIGTGIATLFTVAFLVSPRPRWLDPTLSGIVLAAIAYLLVMTLHDRRGRSVPHA
jgi:Na+/pantothenate symporter